MKKTNKSMIKFSVLEIALWSGYGTLFGFVVLFLQSRQLQDAQISLVMLLCSALGAVSQPLFGYLCDFYVSPRKWICMLYTLCAGLGCLMPFVQSQMVTVVLVLVIAFFEFSLTSLVDGFITKSAGYHQIPLHYGLVRGLGSLGYAIAALCMGRVLEGSITVMFWVHGALMLSGAVCIWFCEDVRPKAAGPKNNPQTGFLGALKELLQNRPYVTAVVCAALVNMALNAGVTFLPLLMVQQGGTSGDYGIALAVMTLCEVPPALCYSLLAKKCKHQWLLAVSFVGVTARILLYTQVQAPWAFIALQTLQMVGWGLMVPALVQYIGQITPLHLRATAVTAGMACVGSVSSVAANLLGSLLVGSIQIYGVLYLVGSIALVATGYFFAALLDKRRR